MVCKSVASRRSLLLLEWIVDKGERNVHNLVEYSEIERIEKNEDKMLQNPCGACVGRVRGKNRKLSDSHRIVRRRKVIHKMRIL